MGKPAAAAVSIASNAVLIALKLAAAAITGSVAILSEALHSSVDLIASVVAFVSVRRADEPAEVEHPYGHEKLESLAASIEGMLILVGAGLIVYEAVHRLATGAVVESLGVGIAVIGFSAVANGGVSLFLSRQARRHSSAALAGDAAHLGTDALTSLGVLLGLVLVQITGADEIDAAVAIAVAAVIVFAGVRILRRSASALVDEAPPPAEMDRIERAIAGGGARLSQAPRPDQRPAPVHRPARAVPQRHHPGAGARPGPRASGCNRVRARGRRGSDPRRA
jgi:cation diffusion facilitator family transporter